MTKIERRKRITDYLKKSKKASRDELANMFNVSLMTISRDLKELEERGVLASTYGGIFYREFLFNELQYEKKKENNIDIKRKIAQLAFEEIKSNMTLILDAGTTTFELATLIVNSNLENLTIITNDLHIALSLYKNKNIKVKLLGGEISINTGATQGYISIEEMKMYNSDISFIGISAITEDYYLSCPNEIRKMLKLGMIRQGMKKILLADASKFNKKKLYNIASLDEFDLIITNYCFKDNENNEVKYNKKVRYIK